MTRQRLPHLLGLLCLTLFVAHSAATARAQSLGISPAFVDAKVRSGATYTKDYTLTNNTGVRLRVRCSVGDYWYDERTNARVEGRPGTLPRSASAWVQFSPAEFIVEPHGASAVRAIISVPQGATGGFYTLPTFDIEAADFPAAAGREGTASAAVMVNFRGLLMLSTVGSSEYNVEVMGGRAEPPTPASPLKLSLDVRNRSTAHVTLRGQFAVLNAASGFAGRGRIDEQRFMPGQRNELAAAWADELAPGRYTAVVTLTYERAGLEPASLVYEIPFEIR
jgi:hypothetical protein